MSQCLFITFSLVSSKDFLHDVIQKKARSLGIEGTVRIENDNGKFIKILACGSRDAMQELIDELHAQAAKDAITNIEIEPFIKEKDFRGVFRVIE